MDSAKKSLNDFSNGIDTSPKHVGAKVDAETGSAFTSLKSNLHKNTNGPTDVPISSDDKQKIKSDDKKKLSDRKAIEISDTLSKCVDFISKNEYNSNVEDGTKNFFDQLTTCEFIHDHLTLLKLYRKRDKLIIYENSPSRQCKSPDPVTLPTIPSKNRFQNLLNDDDDDDDDDDVHDDDDDDKDDNHFVNDIVDFSKAIPLPIEVINLTHSNPQPMSPLLVYNPDDDDVVDDAVVVFVNNDDNDDDLSSSLFHKNKMDQSFDSPSSELTKSLLLNYEEFSKWKYGNNNLSLFIDLIDIQKSIIRGDKSKDDFDNNQLERFLNSFEMVDPCFSISKSLFSHIVKNHSSILGRDINIFHIHIDLI